MVKTNKSDQAADPQNVEIQSKKISKNKEQTPFETADDEDICTDQSKSKAVDKMYEQMFQTVKMLDQELVDKRDFMSNIYDHGILQDDPRIQVMKEKFEDLDENKVTKEQFIDCVKESVNMVEKALAQDFVIPEFKKFKNEVKQIYNRIGQTNKEGKLADYIPELANANPNNWGVSVCTIDGQRFNLGKTKELYSVQSTSKPISYGIALEALGPEKVHKHVGHEPSGVSFNAIALNPDGLPHNPLINSGAIMVASLIQPQMEESARFQYCVNMWQKLAGGKRITYDNTIFLSERNTADTNHALAYLMKSTNAFPEGADINKVLEFYFQCCSLQSDCDTMSIIAGTLANGGICPLTGERIFKSETVKMVLSIMNSCGMYDYSGEFAFKVGLPAKSGVSGAVMTIIPGLMGVCTYAPPLDKYGNSAKGVQFITEVSQKYSLHYFQIDNKNLLTQRSSDFNKDAQNLLHYCAMGDLEGVKRLTITGVDLNKGDYDGRTPLHLAASEGHLEIIEFLVSSGQLKDLDQSDRWGNTALDDAKRGIFHQVEQYLVDHGAKVKGGKRQKKGKQ